MLGARKISGTPLQMILSFGSTRTLSFWHFRFLSCITHDIRIFDRYFSAKNPLQKPSFVIRSKLQLLTPVDRQRLPTSFYRPGKVLKPGNPLRIHSNFLLLFGGASGQKL